MYYNHKKRYHIIIKDNTSTTIDLNSVWSNIDVEYNENYDDCAHSHCPECNGTGVKKSNGAMCIHMISCQCKKCTPYCL